MRRTAAIILFLAILILSITVTTTASNASPLLPISDCQDLLAFDDDVSQASYDFYLTQDIDCTGVAFTSLWNDGTPFAGVLNGRYHEISGLTIAQSSRVGLIAHAGGATIRNLFLRDVDITGNYKVGGLIGEATGTYVNNVHVNGIVRASEQAGLLIGTGTNVSVNRSSGKGTVKSNIYTGGLIGLLSAGGNGESYVQNSFGDAELTNVTDNGQYGFGGLIGYVIGFGDETGESNVYISDSYGKVNVDYETSISDLRDIGGLIGGVNMGSDGTTPSSLTVERTYGTGYIKADKQAGGLIGGYADIGEYVTIRVADSYANAIIDSPFESAGFVGRGTDAHHGLDSENNYFDASVSGKSVCTSIGDYSSSCVAVNIDGDEPDLFYGNDTASPLDSWDFENSDWAIRNGDNPMLDFDRDDDGKTTSEELSGPNNGDANDDGIDDSLQCGVAFANGIDGQMSLSATGGACISVFGAPASYTQNDTYDFPFGVLDFEMFVEPESTTTVSLFFYTDKPVDGFVAFKVDGANLTPIPNAIITSGGTTNPYIKVTYEILDGGPLDTNAMADGYIIDPVGIGIKPTSNTPTVIPAPTDAAVTGASGALSDTGSNSFQLAAIAFSLVILGAFIVLAFRRKRLLL